MIAPNKPEPNDDKPQKKPAKKSTGVRGSIHAPPTNPFPKGNKCSPGNMQAKRINDIRAALLNAVSPKDMAEVIKVLVEQAKAGDVASAKEVMDRIMGKAVQPIFAESNVNVGGAIQIVYSDDWYGTRAANFAATNAAPAIGVD
jgi:hypothetical protein